MEETTEEQEAKWDGPRCHNKEANCNHLTAIHEKKGLGRCMSQRRVRDTAFWERCKCKGVVK